MTYNTDAFHRPDGLKDGDKTLRTILLLRGFWGRGTAEGSPAPKISTSPFPAVQGAAGRKSLGGTTSATCNSA